MRLNSKLTILSLTIIVGLIAFSLIKQTTAASGPIGLGIQSYTYACAVVTVTNLSRVQCDYSLKVERKTKDGWPNYKGGIPAGIDSRDRGSCRREKSRR